MAKKKIHLVVNEGEIVYASPSREKAEDYAHNRMEEDIDELCDDEDVDIDFLDEDDLAELAFKSGYENGCYDVHTEMIEMDDENDEIEYELPDGETYYLSDVTDVLDLV